MMPMTVEGKTLNGQKNKENMANVKAGLKRSVHEWITQDLPWQSSRCRTR
jgi:hypothetical protein